MTPYVQGVLPCKRSTYARSYGLPQVYARRIDGTGTEAGGEAMYGGKSSHSRTYR